MEKYKINLIIDGKPAIDLHLNKEGQTILANSIISHFVTSMLWSSKQSIVLYSQMIGRGLRGPAVGGTENCSIITVKDNISGLPDENNIFTYFDNYFEQ